MATVQSVMGNRMLAAGKVAAQARWKVGNTEPLIERQKYEMERNRAEHEERMAMIGQLAGVAKNVAGNFAKRQTMKEGAQSLVESEVAQARTANPKLTEEELSLWRMDREKYYKMPSVNPLAAKDVKGFFGNLLNAFQTGFLGPNLNRRYGDVSGRGLLWAGRSKKMGFGDQGAEQAYFMDREDY